MGQCFCEWQIAGVMLPLTKQASPVEVSSYRFHRSLPMQSDMNSCWPPSAKFLRSQSEIDRFRMRRTPDTVE